MTLHHNINSVSFSFFDVVCMKIPFYLLILFVVYMSKKEKNSEAIQPGWIELNLKRDY